ncbi:DUF3237 family protein [Butyrivibrio sp. JL13D10]|uniref:DUF3237 family protein n=1 Tax=Butyrivibrio sp. JL13D10 TaxID=3236815 RepID=UPI0038B5809B
MGKEVLTIDVKITAINEVKGKAGTARMILFDGDASSEYFKGTILPGGVDTQKEKPEEGVLLSARYILDGTDYKGNACRIFIENNGSFKGEIDSITKPMVITDSKALEFLETAPLYGSIEGIEGGVKIHIFTENDNIE